MFMAAMAGISAVSGLLSAKESSDAQKAGIDAQERAQQESLAFQREQYDRWKSIYGDVEENLGKFYSGLTPEYIATQGLEEEAKNYQTTMTQVKERFGQLGVTTGAQADIEANLALQNAERKATIRAEAPFKTADLQQSFLSMGANRGPENYGRALETQASRAGQGEFMTAQQQGQEAASSFSAAIDFAKLYGKEQGTQTVTPNTTGGVQ